jgi:hypothetical protein
MSHDECRVDVKAEDLVGALQALKAAQTRGKDICVSFREGALEFARGVTTVRVPASGNWSRTALVSVDLVKELVRRRKALPETFVLSGGQSMLHFSHYSIPCRWVDSRKDLG